MDKENSILLKTLIVLLFIIVSVAISAECIVGLQGVH